MCHSCPITSNHYTLRADARQGRCELYLAIVQECSQRRGGPSRCVYDATAGLARRRSSTYD